MTDTVLTYKGRPVTDLTKNELVDAMTWAFQEIEYQRERADRLLNAAALAEPEPEGPTDEELIRRLLLLAEQAVKEALDFEYEDPEDRYIWRELQELKQLVKEPNGQA